MPEFTLDIKPYPKQVEFFQATARYIAYGGARGGGKSYAARTKAILLALAYSNLKILFLRKTLPLLYENHVVPMLQTLAGIAKYSSQNKTFTFPNGSRIRMGYCENTTDMENYRGLEEDVIFFEEATQFTQEQIEFILTANRSTRPDFKARAYFTTNPGGPSHGYFKRLFIDRNFKDDEKPEDYYFVPATVYDNEVLMANNPEYIQVLKNLPEHLRKAHLYGDWNVMEGQYFSEFRADIHVIDPIEIPEHWTRFKALDWGSAKPYAVLWATIDYDGCLYIYRELYGSKQNEPNVGTKETAPEVARKIKELEKGEKIDYSIADPAIWIKTGSSGPSIYEDLCNEGLFFAKASNDRLQGWQQVHKRLQGDDTGPMIKIFKNCYHTIRTLPLLAHDKRRIEDVDSDGEDHLGDCVRYLCSSRPWSPVYEDKEKATPKVDRYARIIEKAAGSAGSWMAQ